MPAPISRTRLADVRPDGVRHPAIEIRRAGKGIQNVLVFGDINVARERGLQNHPEGFEGILETDLLAFVIGAAAITDGRFVDASLPLGQLDGDLGLKSETLATEWNTLQQRACERPCSRFPCR